MDQAFASAIRRGRGPRARVLGLYLQPLTLGHLFLLERIECAFPFHTESADLSDLVCGVLVCSQPWRKSERILESRFTERFVRFWGWLTRKQSKDEAAQIFQEYLEDEMRAPETQGEGGELTAPLPFRILTMLMADFHMSERDALDMPLKRAICLWVTEGDRRQTIKLLTERQLKFREWVAEQERIRLEREKSNPPENREQK